MKIVAISVQGQEFLYKGRTAHRVSERSSETICELLNKVRYQLGNGEVWFIHEIDQNNNAYGFALNQKFTLRMGTLKEVRG